MLILDLNSISSSDVLEHMRALGIQRTEGSFEAVRTALENLASAWASAALEDATRETMEEWLEIYREGE